MSSRMTKKLALVAEIILVFSLCATEVFAAQKVSQIVLSDTQRVVDLTRIKHEDINFVQREGLVVGLDGTGDTQSDLAAKLLQKLLDRYRSGGGLKAKDYKSKNIAAVMITATLTPNIKEGDRIDVTVEAIDSSKSIKGGVLLTSFLEGPPLRTKGTYPKDLDPVKYIWAQGRIVVEGSDETVGTVKHGGLVLREIESSIYNKSTQSISLVLNHPDAVMADQIVKAINGAGEMLLPAGAPAGVKLASAIDSKEIRVKVPTEYVSRDRLNEFIARVKKVNVNVEEPAGKILINRKLNGIFITGVVTLREAAFSYNDIAIRVTPVAAPNQPPGITQKTIHTMPKEEDPPIKYRFKSIELQTLVDMLNNLEVKTEDIIAIIEGLHEAGAINARLLYVE
ncbi:MAG: flagellar basal body P-ring protein FlgI [Planctomycetota bacterium]|jgi:flagellar P-ring protein precursor FlgI